jgi:hypothetical protein
MPGVFRQRTARVTVTVRQPHPVSQYMASALGSIYGRGINGHTGAFRYGAAGIATNRTKYGGYVYPPQMFIGWNPKRVAGGAIRYKPSALPATAPNNPTDNPLQTAVATIAAGAGIGY